MLASSSTSRDTFQPCLIKLFSVYGFGKFKVCIQGGLCPPLPSIGRGRASTMLSRRRRAPISLDIIIFHNGTRTCLTSTPITRASDIYIPRLALDRVDIKTPDPCKLRCLRVTISPSREKFVGLRLNTTRSPISKRDNPP